ncbi:MAG: lipopolysaccharide biosynthesis protein RfbH [Gammaproteobacteria bacterium]|nr:lipopolysaccharide biosynthesis protein RfbH [Gammaproteobacteria bacterium]MBU1978220.1 lipopolysaccharide biosynthesis protein RfbH [Gammaproteobacteria bacterium]
MNQDADRRAILNQVHQFAAGRNVASPFRPGEDPVPVSGKVLGPEEFVSMVDSCLDGWLTTGRFNEALEKRLAEFIGCNHVRTVNSGSSANLVAFAALTSPLLGERALKAGDEVITVAAGFPTTVNPMLLYGMTPVFVDVQLGTYNIDVSQLESAVSPKTRAIMLAHTLGNPFDVDAVMALAHKHDLWVIEDCCDALGSTYRNQHVGTFGHIGTLSFYPAHHITMGEGGAVFTSDDTLIRAIESIRDWGRDCWCPPGRDNTCGRRFCWKLGDLPEGYDHKYVYSHLGYNLKISDMQAACGLAQMDRLPGFVESRQRNFDFLRERLSALEDFLILPITTSGSRPSWFGLPLTLKEGAGVNRVDLLRYLDQNRIGTRLLFAGNLTHQPYFAQQQYRCVDNLPNTDRVMRDTFWVGIYPGLVEDQLKFISQKIAEFFGHGL